MNEKPKIAIIPHPNELKVISLFQRSLCASIQHELNCSSCADVFCAPVYPLYVFFSDGCLDTSNTSFDKMTVSACVVSSPVIQENDILLPANITCTDSENDGHEGFITIGRICFVSNKNASKLSSEEKAIVQKKLSESPFSLSLPVFRLALVQLSKKTVSFTINGKSSETAAEAWTVVDSKWMKRI